MSGAIRPIIANVIGIPQQKICGAIVAMIPIFTALFFMFFYPVCFMCCAFYILFIILSITKKIDIKIICGMYSYMNTKNTNLSTVDNSHWDKGPVYLFSNENTAGTVKAMGDLSGRKILSVCASGDFVLDGYLAGAKQIDVFDINSYQYAVLELKMHMIKNLPYNTFQDFFFSQGRFFDVRLLDSIKSDFSDLLNEFIWDYRYVSGLSLFVYGGALSNMLRGVGATYLKSADNYYALRERLPSTVKFYNCLFQDLSSVITEKYDDMYFSNIYDYVEKKDLPLLGLMDFYYRYLCVLSKFMSNKNARILFRYMWGVSKEQIISWRNIFERDLKNKRHDFGVSCVSGAFVMDKYDMIMSMRQKNR